MTPENEYIQYLLKELEEKEYQITQLTGQRDHARQWANYAVLTEYPPVVNKNEAAKEAAEKFVWSTFLWASDRWIIGEELR